MKVGIVGAGSIVKELLSVKDKIEGVEFEYIFTRREEAARVIAEKYNIPNIAKSYDELLSSDAEIVYIALPNDLHFEYARRAIESGKSVVLEKPFTKDLDECDTLISLASEKGVCLFEAISNIHTKILAKAHEFLEKSGKIKKAKLGFMQRSRRYDDFRNGIIHPVFDKNKCGGALYDLGVYPMHILVALFGAPESVKYSPKIEKEVDVAGKLVFKYKNFKASCEISKCKEGDNGLLIECERGRLMSGSKPNELSDLTVSVKGGEVIYSGNSGAERLVYQWEDFRDIYNEGDKQREKALLDNTRTVMKLIDEIKKA